MIKEYLEELFLLHQLLVILGMQDNLITPHLKLHFRLFKINCCRRSKKRNCIALIDIKTPMTDKLNENNKVKF